MIDLHLMVISYPQRREALFEAMALHFAKQVSDSFKLERCQTGDDLLEAARMWKKRHYQINTIDLFGHGAGGQFKLGDSLLFASDGTGYPLAKKLGGQLARDASLRLLGCRTALVDRDYSTNRIRFSGPKLLDGLTKQLGLQRVAWGSKAYIGTRQLAPTGFDPRVERQLVRGRL